MAGIKTKRFKEMDGMGKSLVKEIEVLKKILETYQVFSDAKLAAYTLSYFKSKIDNKPLRAYFCRKLYEYLSEAKTADGKGPTKWKELFFLKLPFLFEMVIVIQYLENHILDDKYDVRKGQDKTVNQNLISANILRALLFLYLDKEVTPLLADEKQVLVIHRLLSRLLLFVDLGQRIDKEYNNYQCWVDADQFPLLLEGRYLFPPFVQDCISSFSKLVKTEVTGKDPFIDGYFQRLYLTNVYFFECIVEIVLTMMNYEGREKGNLRKFAIQYGYMLQIINDYADFAYSPNKKEQALLKTGGKKTTDFFADLYNFNITLPLIYHLEEGSRRKIEAYLAGGRRQKKILTQYPMQIVNEIKESGAIRKCIDLSRQLSLSARICLDEKNSMTPYFENMCDIAMKNKFYNIFI